MIACSFCSDRNMVYGSAYLPTFVREKTCAYRIQTTTYNIMYMYTNMIIL